jgi:hypothetical protein
MCHRLLLFLSIVLCTQMCRGYLPTHVRGANLLHLRGRVSNRVPLTRLLPSFLPDDVEAGPGPEISGRGGDGALANPLAHEAERSSLAAAVWAFTRPHTLIGSAISIASLFAYATPASLLWTPAFFRALGHAVLPACAMNIYITGLNQVRSPSLLHLITPHCMPTPHSTPKTPCIRAYPPYAHPTPRLHTYTYIFFPNTHSALQGD